MSLFGKVLEKLGIMPSVTVFTPSPEVLARAAAQDAMPRHAAPAAPAAPAPIAVVDVMAKLESMAAARPQKLNWKVSIVDLLTLLGLESSYAVRKEMAVELGCPAEKMGDSAQMNMWLHKTVLQKIAANGGNIPQDLLD